MYNNAIPTFIDHSNVIPQPPLSYGYATPVHGHCVNVRGCESFIIIIVLFILLIIIGAIAFCF
ncbi:YjcZ family sporulation protein [Neobacillus drentensis]|uniref:YjcZ family sporulation protein n=1 Tax=Neobacillus drentensis TaxID=220684 RepID=UPI003000FC93